MDKHKNRARIATTRKKEKVSLLSALTGNHVASKTIVERKVAI